MATAGWKIGVYGSGGGENEGVITAAAQAVGKELARHICIVITGAAAGIPYAAAHAAREAGGKIWGFAPAADYESFSAMPPLGPHKERSFYDRLVFVPPKFEFIDHPSVRMKYRNVVSTASCDAGIIIAGRWGTLNEFTDLVDMGKVVGVLTGTGGIADEIPRLWEGIKKEGNKAAVLFDSDPTNLVRRVFEELDNRQVSQKS